MKKVQRFSAFLVATYLLLLPQIAQAASWHDRLCRWLWWLPEWFIVWIHELIGVL